MQEQTSALQARRAELARVQKEQARAKVRENYLNCTVKDAMAEILVLREKVGMPSTLADHASR